MKSRSEEQEANADATDRLLADLMDDYLTEPVKPAVRYIRFQSNGRMRTVKVTGNLIWFPVGGKRRAKK
jgi:hypothetical protein